MKKIISLISLCLLILGCNSDSDVSNYADACKCVSVFNGQSLKKSMGGVPGGDDYNRCLGKYKNWSTANNACVKYKKSNPRKKKENTERMEGLSKVTDPDGNIYEGEFFRGQFHGPGKMIYTDGSVYEGEWINMHREGVGNITFSNGDVWEGKWNDGKATIDGSWKKYSQTWYEEDPAFVMIKEKIVTDPHFGGGVHIRDNRRKESTDKERLGYFNLTMLNVIPTSYELSIINRYSEFATGNKIYSEKFDVDAYLFLKEFDLSHLSTGFYHCEIRMDSYTINGSKEIKKFEQKIRVRETRSARKKNRKK